jgi:hypothetical protein
MEIREALTFLVAHPYLARPDRIERDKERLAIVSDLILTRSLLERATEALKPFALLADDYLADTVNFDDDTIMAGRMTRRGNDGSPPRVTFADYRSARATLTAIEATK